MPLLRSEAFQLFTPQGRAINQPLSFAVNNGELLFITGKNGSGKSTLLRAFIGLHRFYQGNLTRELKRSEFAYLPQISEENLAIPVSLADILNASFRRFETFGLLSQEQLALAWNTASGGERRRTHLVRLFNQPSQCFLLDEPFNHLDCASIEILASLIKKRLSTSSTSSTFSVILATHQIETYLPYFSNCKTREIKL